MSYIFQTRASNGRSWLSISRATSMMSLTFVGVCIALSGCDKLAQSGSANTISLLRSGAEQVCVAQDVRKTLHDVIIPKVADVVASGSADDKLNAINSISLSYDMTTLQNFDKAVSKASCSATIKVSRPGDESQSFDIDYIVSPSAENSSEFIITARSKEAKGFALTLVDHALQGLATARQAQEDEGREKQAKAQLLATVSPKWLVGSWIAAGEGSSNCSNGEALSLTPNHMFKMRDISARWTLNGDQLHLIGSRSEGAIDQILTMTQADAVSFNATNKEGDSVAWRRCSADEIETPSQPSEGATDEPNPD